MSAAPTPPAKLSALLALAVGDMERLMEDDRYRPDSSEWHRPIGETGRCHACLAGAVIAQRLGGRPDREMFAALDDADYDGGGDWWDALRLIDAWRGGHPGDVQDQWEAYRGAAMRGAAVDVLDARDGACRAVPAALQWTDAETARAALDVLRAEVERLEEAGL